MFSQLPVRTTGVVPPLKACSLNTVVVFVLVVVAVVVVVVVVVFVAATAHSAGQSGSGFKETFTVGDIEGSFLHVLSVGAVVPRNLWKALSRIYLVFSSGMNCDPHQLIKRDISDVFAQMYSSPSVLSNNLCWSINLVLWRYQSGGIHTWSVILVDLISRSGFRSPLLTSTMGFRKLVRPRRVPDWSLCQIPSWLLNFLVLRASVRACSN